MQKNNNTLYHYGVEGMKWDISKKKNKYPVYDQPEIHSGVNNIPQTQYYKNETIPPILSDHTTVYKKHPAVDVQSQVKKNTLVLKKKIQNGKLLKKLRLKNKLKSKLKGLKLKKRKKKLAKKVKKQKGKRVRKKKLKKEVERTPLPKQPKQFTMVPKYKVYRIVGEEDM